MKRDIPVPDRLDVRRPKNDTQDWTRRLVNRYNQLSGALKEEMNVEDFKTRLGCCEKAQDVLENFEEDVEETKLKRDAFPNRDATADSFDIVCNAFTAAERLGSRLEVTARWLKGVSCEKGFSQEVKDNIKEVFASDRRKSQWENWIS